MRISGPHVHVCVRAIECMRVEKHTEAMWLILFDLIVGRCHNTPTTHLDSI